MTILTPSYTQSRTAAGAEFQAALDEECGAKVEACSLYRKFLAAECEFQAALEEDYGADAETWRYRTESLTGKCKAAAVKFHAASDAFWAAAA
jgi:hypothetical protein